MARFLAQFVNVGVLLYEGYLLDLQHKNICTSGRRSNRSAFRQLTGTTIVHHYFPYSFFLFFFSLSQPFFIERVPGSKNLFRKSLWKRLETILRPLAAILNLWGSHRRNDRFKKTYFSESCSDTHRAFWINQALRCCSRCGVTGG